MPIISNVPHGLLIDDVGIADEGVDDMRLPVERSHNLVVISNEVVLRPICSFGNIFKYMDVKNRIN